MALMPQTFRVICSGTLQLGERWTNVFHVRDDGPIAEDFDQNLVNALGGAFESAYAQLVDVWADTTTLDTIQVVDLRTEPNESRMAEGVAQGPGVDVTPLPPQLAAVVSWGTASTSRRQKGRTYIAGLGVGNLDGNGLLATGSRTVLGEFATTLREAIEDEGVFLDLHLAIASEADGVSRDITRWSVGNVLDTQRRRRNALIEARIGGTFT